MERSIQNFAKVDIAVTPYPTDFLVSEEIALYPNQFVPSDFSYICLALKEYLGLLALSIPKYATIRGLILPEIPVLVTCPCLLWMGTP